MQLLHEKKDNKHLGTCTVKSVIKLLVCHSLYVTLVTERVLIIFFPEKIPPKKTAGGAYRSRGANWGEYGTLSVYNSYWTMTIYSKLSELQTMQTLIRLLLNWIVIVCFR